MNTVTDDYGRRVIAIGAPYSVERVKIERPYLIATYQSRWNQTCGMSQPYSASEAHDDLQRQDGINSKLERDSILACTSIT